MIHIYILFCVGFSLNQLGKTKWNIGKMLTVLVSPIYVPMWMGMMVYDALNKYLKE